jgi:hypothetical protein
LWITLLRNGCQPNILTDFDAVTPGTRSSVTPCARSCRPGRSRRRPIDHKHLDHELAVAATREALADGAVPAIYEAAVTSDGVRVRADILVRVPGEAFDLIEVKSTARVKPEHAWDLAVQLHALKAADLPIRRAYVMHLDRSYVHQGGDHDVGRLFALEDLTECVRPRQYDVRRALGEMRAPFALPECPKSPLDHTATSLTPAHSTNIATTESRKIRAPSCPG